MGLAWVVITTSSIKGTIAAVRALIKVGWVQHIVAQGDMLLAKVVAHLHLESGPSAEHWGLPKMFLAMVT